jgi:hypothetical protein
MTGVEPPADDPRIRDEDVLLRRVPALWILTEESGATRPRSAAFQDITAPDGTRAMSVYVERLLADAGLTDVDVLEGRIDLGLVAFAARAVRDAGHTLHLAPHEGPLGPAHAEVPGKIKASSRRSSWPRRTFGGCLRRPPDSRQTRQSHPRVAQRLRLADPKSGACEGTFGQRLVLNRADRTARFGLGSG